LNARRQLRRFALACAAGLLWLPAVAAAAAPNDELNALRRRLEALQKELAAAEEVKGEAADQLKESERAISEAKRALREIADEQKTVNARLRELDRAAQRTQGGIAKERRQLGELLARQYASGTPQPLKLALNGDDPNRITRDLYYLAQVARARAALVTKLRGNLAELNALARETASRKAELAVLEKRQAEENVRLERESQARRAVLQKVSLQIAAQRRELSTLKRDEARLTRLVEGLGRALASKPGGLRNERLPDASADGRAFADLKGRLALPVRGELKGRFGSPRGEGGLTWKGVFVAAGTGQEVKAVAGGRVVYADWLRGFGNLLIIDHGGGYMSLYGSNEALYKQAGDAARAGETVATVGATGGGAESGLYFELRLQGKPFDPLSWVNLQ
jgi:septal ring factor EnvC (AmiA/AmiB activator)